MNRQINNARPRNWPHALLESAVLGSALLVASAALANTPVVSEPAKSVVKELQQAKTYTITSPPAEPLAMQTPELPDLSGYTTEAALKKIDRSSKGKVRVTRMMDEETGMKEFVGGDNKMAEWVARQRGIPQIIVVENGYASLQDVARQVPKQMLSEVSPGVFIARVPILVKESLLGVIETATFRPFSPRKQKLFDEVMPVVAMNLETTEEELIHAVFPHPTLSEMMHESVLDAYGRAVHV